MNSINSINTGVVGSSIDLSITDLLLDVENPRFGLKSKVESQEDVVIKLEMAFDIISIAESISRNGFFANEPLIVIKAKEKNKYTVIEGNRRFAALLGLTNESIRKKLYQAENFEELASKSVFNLKSKVPCTLVDTRDKIASILGFRHISGILEWQPYAQAVFIAKLIDEEGRSFEEVAKDVGKSKNEIAGMYRNQAIAKQAADVGMNTIGLEKSFSALTVAMSSPGIRAFIAAPLGSAVTPGIRPIPEVNYGELKELLSYLFGDDLKPPVISDTREINRLGKIIQNPIGLETLRKTRSTSEAEAAIKEQGMDPYTRLINRLKTANESVKSTFDDIPDYIKDENVQAYIQSLDENVASLRNIIEND